MCGRTLISAQLLENYDYPQGKTLQELTNEPQYRGMQAYMVGAIKGASPTPVMQMWDQPQPARDTEFEAPRPPPGQLPPSPGQSAQLSHSQQPEPHLLRWPPPLSTSAPLSTRPSPPPPPLPRHPRQSPAASEAFDEAQQSGRGREQGEPAGKGVEEAAIAGLAALSLVGAIAYLAHTTCFALLSQQAGPLSGPRTSPPRAKGKVKTRRKKSSGARPSVHPQEKQPFQLEPDEAILE